MTSKVACRTVFSSARDTVPDTIFACAARENHVLREGRTLRFVLTGTSLDTEFSRSTNTVQHTDSTSPLSGQA